MNTKFVYKNVSKQSFWKKNWNACICNLPSDSCEEQIEFYIKAIEHGAVDIAWTTTYAAQSSQGLIDEKAAKCVEVFLLKKLHKIILITN